MPKLYLTPGTVERISKLEKDEMMQAFDRDGVCYTGSRDGDHVRIEIVDH